MLVGVDANILKLWVHQIISMPPTKIAIVNYHLQYHIFGRLHAERNILTPISNTLFLASL